MVPQPQFGNNSVGLSYNKDILFITAIAPHRERTDVIIFNDSCDNVLFSASLNSGINGAEDLFNTGCGLFFYNIKLGDELTLTENKNYNVIVSFIDSEGVTKLNQYNFIYKPLIKEQYSDSPATQDDVKSAYIGNQMIEFYKATEDNVTRGVSIGDLDHITYKVKCDVSSDWKTPVSEQTQYVWYFPDGKVEYRKESD